VPIAGDPTSSLVNIQVLIQWAEQTEIISSTGLQEQHPLTQLGAIYVEAASAAATIGRSGQIPLPYSRFTFHLIVPFKAYQFHCLTLDKVIQTIGHLTPSHISIFL
jgi:hypothetical protein